MTTLRNIVGGMDLEETLTSRDQINSGLRGVLDEATGKWGIRVNRVEIKGIDPPPSIKDSMEKQMRADREKRAVDPHRRGPAPGRDPDRRGLTSSPRSSTPRVPASRRSCGPRPTGSPRSCAPRARARPSRRSSRPSTTATPTSRCWPTSTSR